MKANKELNRTFLTLRPELGKTWIVDMRDLSGAEILFLRTLQGSVNRSEARLYLIGSDDERCGEAERFWIEEYAKRGWVHMGGYLSLEQAIGKFGSELNGFIRASEAEPWTINAAAAAAALKNAAVAPDSLGDRLLREGWSELEDMRGRWNGDVPAYREMVDRYGERLAYPGLALLHPREQLWDFVVQQQIMPLYSRPKNDSWDAVAEIIDSYPPGHVLYGYVSDDTVEEEIAVERTSSSGKYLVPTSNVSNLSFHIAVQADKVIKPLGKKGNSVLTDFDPEQLYVVIAITDGDNLHVPIQQYPGSKFWNTPRRGELPLGWSMGVSLSILAQGIWEVYRDTAKENDEIISLMGLAYVHAAVLPEPEQYYGDTFAAMKNGGISTLWSLDSSLTITDSPLWDVLENSPSREALNGLLLGYGPSVDKAFRRETGTPVMITQNGYSEDANRLKERIEELLEQDPSERSPVNFLMATNWSTNAADLYETLKPLEEKGVRFLTPAQALASMPDIRGIACSELNREALPGSCSPVGAVEQFGSAILSAPTLAEISKPLPLPVKVRVDAARDINSGENLNYTAVLSMEPYELARDFLEQRVLPVVEGFGLSDEFAEFAWMKMEIRNCTIDLVLPDGTVPGDILETEGQGTGVPARFDNSILRINLEGFTADSRKETAPDEISLRFSAEPDTSVAGHSYIMESGSLDFDFTLTIGIGDEEGPLVGGVRGRMTGRAVENLTETRVRR